MKRQALTREEREELAEAERRVEESRKKSNNCAMCKAPSARMYDKILPGLYFCDEFCHNRYYGILSGNLEMMTIANSYYRRVLVTTPEQQTVLMCITEEDGNEIEREVHGEGTQFIRIEKGEALVTIGDRVVTVGPGGFVVIPKKTAHYVRNISKRGAPLQLYTVYSPPQHAPDLIQERRSDPDRKYQG